MGSAVFQRNVPDLGVRGTAAHVGLDCFSFWIGVLVSGRKEKRQEVEEKQLGE